MSVTFNTMSGQSTTYIPRGYTDTIVDMLNAVSDTSIIYSIFQQGCEEALPYSTRLISLNMPRLLFGLENVLTRAVLANNNPLEKMMTHRLSFDEVLKQDLVRLAGNCYPLSVFELRYFDNIQILHIVNVQMEDMRSIGYMKNCHELKFALCERCGDITGLTNIKSLIFAGCYIQYITSSTDLPKLEKLVVEGYTNVKKIDLINRVPNIQRIKLYSVPNIRDVSFIKHASNLMRLQMIQTPQIDRSIIKHLPDNCSVDCDWQ